MRFKVTAVMECEYDVNPDNYPGIELCDNDESREALIIKIETDIYKNEPSMLLDGPLAIKIERIA